MQDKNNTNNISPLFADLKELELKISQQLGSAIFDYLFLFSDIAIEEITFPPLTTETRNLIENYLRIYEKIAAEINLQPVQSDTLEEKFLETLRDVYQLRFLEAQFLFSEYQLERVPTKTEAKMIKDFRAEEMPLNIGIFIDGAFVENKNGFMDIVATQKKEESQHQIKSYLSAYSQAILLKNKMFYNLLDITTRGMVPRLYQNELLAINEEILSECISYFAAKVYDYIKRGFLPKDARANILSFYNNILQKQNSQFTPQMQDLEQNLRQILQARLEKIGKLEHDTVADLIDQYLELVKIYIQAGILLPKTLFNLEFRKVAEEVFIDSYLIFETGELSSAPVETYKIALSDAAKAVIFDHVTNGIENPYFTLEDYLAEV